MLQFFRWLGRLEGVSFLILLFIAVPLKRIWGKPEAVQFFGMVHGILFLAYILLVNHIALILKWNKKVWFLAYVAAVLPFGTFLFEKHHVKDKEGNES